MTKRLPTHLNAPKPSNLGADNGDLYAPLWVEAAILLFWLGLALLIGLYIGHVLPSILLVLIGYGIWHAYALLQFRHWIDAPAGTPPPHALGGLSVIAADLYHKRKQEKATQQTLMRLVKNIQSSLLSLQDAVILLNDKDGIEWWNQAAEDLLSLGASDQGASILSLIPEPKFHEYYQHATMPNNGIYLHSWQDAKRYLRCELTRFGGEKLLIIYDVTRLQHLEQMRRDFVANVSHELRTPLTVLMGYLETFLDQPDISPQLQRGLDLMSQQTARMNRIVHDLLLLSRLENEETPARRCIDMRAMITQLIGDATLYNQDYGHHIALEQHTSMGIHGAEHDLYSALLNLIINAIKYTPKGGRIEIGWHQTAAGAVFSVTDNGIGIKDEHISRLTERFYRVDSARSRATGGTGLGLAIVKHVVHQHHARLEIKSSIGAGSCFEVIFDKDSLCLPDQTLKDHDDQDI